MLHDLRFAARLLQRNPGFAAAAILTIALGVGLNVAVFTLVRAVLLRPLPFTDPDRVVAVYEPYDGPARSRDDTSPLPLAAGQVQDWHRLSSPFSDLAAVQLWQHDVSSRIDWLTDGRAERLRGAYATPNFFSLLGMRAALGRTFTPEDSRESLTQSVVLSNRAWRRLFGADSSVIGRTLSVATGRSRARGAVTVIGVLPPEFHYTYPEETEIWLPLTWDEVYRDPRGGLAYQVVARLNPGVSARAAAADLNRIEGHSERARFRNASRIRQPLAVVPIRQQLSHSARPLLLTLSEVALLVLLIACVNVTGLQLGRAAARRGEIATRAALGASGFHLLRQALAESLVIGASGFLAGLAVAAVGLPAFRSLVPAMLPRGNEIRLDGALLLAWALALIGAVVMSTAIPVWFGGRTDPEPMLRQRSGASRTTHGRRLLIALQVAGVFVLVAGAGLLLESFWRLTHVHTGFQGDGIVTMEMRVLHDRFDDQAADNARLARFDRAVLEAIEAIPAVEEAAITSAVPLRGTDWLRVLHVTSRDGHKRDVGANEREVTPTYFRVMGIRLIAGRLFTDADDPTAPARMIVSASLARRIAGDEQSAVGRILPLDVPTEIVGVVDDVRSDSLAQAPRPAYYVPRAQSPSPLLCLVIRPKPGQQASVGAAALGAIHRIDPRQTVQRVTTIDHIVDESVADRRFNAVVTGAFAAIGLLLALVGLAGAVSRHVIERTREIAIRIALGAEIGSVRRLVLRQALVPVAVGLGTGAIASIWLTRWLQSQLFGVEPHDPLTLAGAGLGVIVFSAVTACLSAEAATRIDPITALRAE